MKAAILEAGRGLERLRLSQVPEPGEPGRGEICVRLRANSINYHDYAVVMGMLPLAKARIPLSDGAGEVLAVGADVQELIVGDRVLSCFFPDWMYGQAPRDDFASVPGDGVDGYAQQAVIRPAHWFTRAPKGFDFREAATLPTAGLTAWRALAVECNVQKGDTVLVMGTGGVSLFALQFAKAMGATVVATSSSDEKLSTLKALGASEVINYRSHPDWGRKVRDLTGGLGVDHIVEVGGGGTLSQSVEAIKIGGCIAVIGVLTGLSGQVPTALLMARQARLQGLTVGSRQQQLEMIKAIDAAGIRPRIGETFPLENLAEAFGRLASGKHIGKISITV